MTNSTQNVKLDAKNPCAQLDEKEVAPTKPKCGALRYERHNTANEAVHDSGYGWMMTRLSLVERLADSVGNPADYEDAWNEFWAKYEQPIRTFIANKFKKEDKVVKEHIGNVHEQIQKAVKKYDINKGRFRDYLRGVISKAVKTVFNIETRQTRNIVYTDKVTEIVDARSSQTTEIAEEESNLWDLAISMEIVSYVRRRFQWSELDRKIIDSLIKNYEKAEASGDEIEKGELRRIANELKCQPSKVTSTRQRFAAYFFHVRKRYAEDKLIIQDAESLKSATLFRYRHLLGKSR